jgi:hypothetical protein
MNTCFNENEINLLIRLFTANILCDFVFYNHKIQTRRYQNHFAHAVISGIVFFILSGGAWLIGLSFMLFHFFMELLKRESSPNKKVFANEQIITHALILIFWLMPHFGHIEILNSVMTDLFTLKMTLKFLGYLLVIWPAGQIIGIVTKSMIKQTNTTDASEVQSDEDIEHAGWFIGVCERIIIITFVYFQQYEAIGFLITGKSILRLNNKCQTEYVLAGTMMSYAISILTGAAINHLIK